MNREATARVGLAPGDVIRAVRIGLVGEEASQIWIGQRRFDLVVRLRDDRRDTFDAIRTLLIDGHDGTRIPLGQLADMTQTFGPAAIRREAGTRRIAVEASVSGRDLGSTATEVRRILTDRLKLPAGYFFDLGGRVESQARASRALALAIGAALFGVFVLLLVALGSAVEAGMILGTVPIAFVGGILALLLAGETWNVSSLVGLIGLFGIAVQNSLVLVTQTRGLLAEGRQPARSGPRGQHRPGRPKLMTAGHRDAGLAAAAGAAAARHRDRAAPGGGHDRRTGDVHALHAARAADVLSAGTWVAGAPRVTVRGRARVTGSTKSLLLTRPHYS